MEAQDAPRGTKRWLVNSGIVLLVFLLAVNALPTLFATQVRLREKLDPLIDGVGLWQGQWELFGPEADKINLAVVGVVEFSDGVVARWRTPDPRPMSPFEKIRYFRWTEYTDSVRLDSNRGAWPALAEYLARNVKHPFRPGIKPVRVSLWRYFVVIPPPESPLRPISDPFPYERRYRFFVQEFTP